MKIFVLHFAALFLCGVSLAFHPPSSLTRCHYEELAEKAAAPRLATTAVPGEAKIAPKVDYDPKSEDPVALVPLKDGGSGFLIQNEDGSLTLRRITVKPDGSRIAPPSALRELQPEELETLKSRLTNKKARAQILAAQLEQMRYKNLKTIGIGGQGVVWRAERPDGVVVALKFPLDDAEHHDFLIGQEARFLSELADQNVPHVPAETNGIVLAGSTRGIEMRFIPESAGSDQPARSLHHHLQHNLFGPTTEDTMDSPATIEKRIEGVLDDVADTLEAAHAKGIIHRDIRPANLLWQTDGTVHVADWGLSAQKLGTSPEATGLIYPGSEGIYSGSRGFAGPNQIRGNPTKEIDDLFALRKLSAELRLASWGANGGSFRYKRIFAPENFDPKDRLAVSEVKYAIEAPHMDASQRQVATAEWSRLPKNIQEWKELQNKARTLPPEEFLPWYGRRLLTLGARVTPTGETVRLDTATEVLSSRYAVENFDTGAGKLFDDPKILGQVALGAFRNYERAVNSLNEGAASLNDFDAHIFLHYRPFFEQVKKLYASGKISDALYNASAKRYFDAEDSPPEN